MKLQLSQEQYRQQISICIIWRHFQLQDLPFTQEHIYLPYRSRPTVKNSTVQSAGISRNRCDMDRNYTKMQQLGLTCVAKWLVHALRLSTGLNSVSKADTEKLVYSSSECCRQNFNKLLKDRALCSISQISGSMSCLSKDRF